MRGPPPQRSRNSSHAVVPYPWTPNAPDRGGTDRVCVTATVLGRPQVRALVVASKVFILQWALTGSYGPLDDPLNSEGDNPDGRLWRG